MCVKGRKEVQISHEKCPKSVFELHICVKEVKILWIVRVVSHCLTLGQKKRTEGALDRSKLSGH